MRFRAFSLLLCATALALASCANTGGTGQRFGARPTVLGARPPAGYATAAARGKTVAILLPLTGPNAALGAAMLKAAQLMLATPGSPRLLAEDTGGTAAGAMMAAQKVLTAGAGMILGPLTAAETAAVAGPARDAGVPVLAFTNDTRAASGGVWTLGLTPAEQVQTLAAAAAAQGKTRFAALLPDNDFGHAMGAALPGATASLASTTPTVQYHAGDGMAGLSATVRALSDYADRRGPLDAQIRKARALHTAEGRREAAQLAREPIPPPPFDALLLADTGVPLAEIASLLAYYDVEAPQVRLLGPALWADPLTRAGSGRALAGAWYAAPDPDQRAAFVAAFSAKYGAAPPGAADLAYDAAGIARVTAAQGGFVADSLTRPEGFLGVDGVLQLRGGGVVRRGLAVFEIERGGTRRVVPAPAS